MIQRTSHEIGREAEALACRYLEDQGLETVCRNHRCRYGEIDLVMLDGQCLVFVEVRYRRNTRFGDSGETIGATKRQRLAAAAAHFMQKAQPKTPESRFDVVAISGQGDSATIEWIKDAFQL